MVGSEARLARKHDLTRQIVTCCLGVALAVESFEGAPDYNAWVVQQEAAFDELVVAIVSDDFVVHRQNLDRSCANGHRGRFAHGHHFVAVIPGFWSGCEVALNRSAVVIDLTWRDAYAPGRRTVPVLVPGHGAADGLHQCEERRVLPEGT